MLIPILDPSFIKNGPGFDPDMHQSRLVSVAQHIEDGFLNQKVDAEFVNLTVAFDTINIRTRLTKVYEMTNNLGFVNILRQILNNRRS